MVLLNALLTDNRLIPYSTKFNSLTDRFFMALLRVPSGYMGAPRGCGAWSGIHFRRYVIAMYKVFL